MKPKIKEILSDFEPTINNIFDNMMETIKPIIKEWFGDYNLLELKVRKLYINYSLEQKKKVLDFYLEIYY